MTTTIQKWGNSLAVRIPKPFAEEVRLKSGTLMDISVQDGEIVLKPGTRARPSLAALLKGVRKGNLHSETSFGQPAGREAW